ncbi:hypothetical protein AGOR_G00002390 [Albula goreensis]|uniref:PH domain-containing protein n=1 Tax=Albula goreensis TaxID=1534307 RepID=A0A8T3E8S4_9TELE|nr:hypothetical protein AGOR_G00002390 [Albula goreensis]
MEDGVKGATPSFSGKAGWVKKSSGKLLGSYKERYVQVEKTEMVVYDNKELQNCLERVDLEKYDKCLEVRSTFKKKNRLVLVRAPKSGSKVHDIKLQVESVEEKEAWIKALGDAINKAKNKIFDEVKVDESCSLDHVTRSRARGNRSRRPPTRIHMKEVASISSDGILRLDLDVVDQTPNGMHEMNSAVDTVEVSDTDSGPKPEASAPKPPMPPSTPSETPSKEEAPSEEEKATPAPPMPPSKESKPNVSEVEEVEEAMPSGTAPDNGGSEPATPETPPDESSASATSPPKPLTPPIPPSKDKKPIHAVEQEPAETPDAKDNEEEHACKSQSDTQLSTTSEQVLRVDGSSPPPSDTPVTPPEDTPTSSELSQTESDQPTSEQKSTPKQEVDPEPEVPPEKEEAAKQDVAPKQDAPSEEEMAPKQDAPSEEEMAPKPEGAASSAPTAPEPLVCHSGLAPAQHDAAPALTPPTKPTEHAPESSHGPPSKPVQKGPGPPAPPKKKRLKPVVAGSDQSFDLKDRLMDNVSPSDMVNPPDEVVSGRGDPDQPAEPPNEGMAGPSQEAGSSQSTEQEEVKSVDSGQHSQDGDDSCGSLEEDAPNGDTPATGVTPREDQLSEPHPDVDDLRSRVAHELQTTQELLGEACRGEAQGFCGEGGASSGTSPAELLMKATEKLQLAELCLREASTLKLGDTPEEKDKRTSW